MAAALLAFYDRLFSSESLAHLFGASILLTKGLQMFDFPRSAATISPVLAFGKRSNQAGIEPVGFIALHIRLRVSADSPADWPPTQINHDCAKTKPRRWYPAESLSRREFFTRFRPRSTSHWNPSKVIVNCLQNRFRLSKIKAVSVFLRYINAQNNLWHYISRHYLKLFCGISLTEEYRLR